MKNKVLAIIPARGGSKRIPRKNVRNFLGKPIIAYSIDSAIKSHIFDEIMVSTDDKKIVEIAKKYKANIPFLRSAKNSDDYATTAQVIAEVLGEYKKIGRSFDFVCCIYATAPFVTPSKLKEAYDLIQKFDSDSVSPVVPYATPIQRSFKIIEDGTLELNWPENSDIRSQDLAVMYHDAGQFYFLNSLRFLVNKKIFTKNSRPLIISETETQDIDNETDWTMAEFKYKLLTRKYEKRS